MRAESETSREHSRLVDRDRELDVVAAALEAAASGTGSLVVIAGAAGTGKSALLAVAAERARALGVAVRSGRGSELEQELSFGVIRQLFEVPVRSFAPAERERLLSGAAAAAAGLFEDAPIDRGARGDGGFATLHGLYWVATGIAAERPLLLTVDDAHWVDEPTLPRAELSRGPDRRRPDRARHHHPLSGTEPSGRGLDEPRVRSERAADGACGARARRRGRDRAEHNPRG